MPIASSLFDCPGLPADGADRKRLEQIIRMHHYTRSVSSGKSLWYEFDTAIICFSIPANCNISRYLLGRSACVWELSRLWAPDGHDKNLLTRAISVAIKRFRFVVPACEALVSYADPNVGHEGFVYRAASWIYLGQCEESRSYRGAAGQLFARRKFHSGNKGFTKAQIASLGYVEELQPGKHRFAFGLTRKAKREIAAKLALP